MKKCPLCQKHDLVKGQVTQTVHARDEKRVIHKGVVTLDCETCPTCGDFFSHDELVLAESKVLAFKDN